MTSEEWRQVQELVEQSLAMPASDRIFWLDHVCKNNASLRKEVDAFLEAFDPAQDFLEGGLAEALGNTAEKPCRQLDGQRIGQYRVLREIGHGGMGTVYLAARSDAEYQKRVAIKVIRRGMDTDAIVRRFYRERQILAALEHPYIARFFDGGTTEDGLPYLVMEYIEGQPIDSFCDSRKLPIPERLKLFGLVCTAIQYAHRNLVVHQDIKPTNILVTQDGTPKLLDFGISKLLNPELGFMTLDRTVAMRLITPEYASPEQVRGESITTAADVYSLGVLLYRLLTGRAPYLISSTSLQEMARVVCEEEPDAPSVSVVRPPKQHRIDSNGHRSPAARAAMKAENLSALLSRQLRGDLDNIVLKALSKEPTRRYSSAEQFGDDIQRHLDNLPVVARRSTLFYRLAKLCRRHGLALAATAVVSVLLVASVGAAVWQAGVARIERARAERRFQDVRKLANSYLFEFHDAIENLPGSTPARVLLVRRALEYLNNLSKEANGDVGIERELASAYQRIGNVQGQPAFANIGDTDGALKSYSSAYSLCEKVVQTCPNSVSDRMALSEICRLKGNLLAGIGRRSEALEQLRKAQQIDRELTRQAPADRQVSIQLALADGALANLQAGVSVADSGLDIQSALQNQLEALRIYRSQLAIEPGNREIEHKAALSSILLGDMQSKLGNTDRALDYYRESLAHFQTGAPNAATQRNLANVLYRIGTAQTKRSDYHQALVTFQKALLLSKILADADPQNVQARADLAYGFADVGEAAAHDGKFGEGLPNLRTGIVMMEQIVAANPHNFWVRSNLMQTYVVNANLLAGSDRVRSNEFLDKAANLARSTLAGDPQDGEARSVLARCAGRASSK